MDPSEKPNLSVSVATEVGGDCVCLAAQRAARAVGRLYDAALRPVGLSNWQFTLLMMLHRDKPPTIGSLANQLAMDRTTVTANLKPLERRGLLAIQVDLDDHRARRLVLTHAGRALIAEAVPLWRMAQAKCTEWLGTSDVAAFRETAATLAAGGSAPDENALFARR